MKNKKTTIIKHLIILLLSSTFIFFVISISPKAQVDFLEINENVSSIEKDMYYIEVGKNDNSYTCINKNDIEEIIVTLKNLKVYEKPIDTELSFNRDKTYHICILDKKGGCTKIYFDKNLNSVWINYSDSFDFMYSPDEIFDMSHIYKVKNSNILNNIFQPLDAYYNEKLYEKDYIDARIIGINDDYLLVKEERLESNIYIEEDWINSLKDSYRLEKIKNEINFQLGDKIRIKFNRKSSNLQDNTISNDEIQSIIFLNEILYIKNNDSSDTKYFTKEDISIAMDMIIMDSSYNRETCSIIYLFCNDECAMDAFLTMDKVYGTDDVDFDVENKLYVFFKVLPSRGVHGEVSRYSSQYQGKYGLGGFVNFERWMIEEMK